MKDAPVFDPTRPRSDYPLSGTLTGPAWRMAWKILQDSNDPTEYLDAVDIVEEVHRVTGVNPRTTRNLLIGAANAGILERVVRLSGGRNRTHYRIAKKFR